MNTTHWRTPQEYARLTPTKRFNYDPGIWPVWQRFIPLEDPKDKGRKVVNDDDK